MPDTPPPVAPVTLWRFTERSEPKGITRHHHYEQPIIYSNGHELLGVEGRWLPAPVLTALVEALESARDSLLALEWSDIFEGSICCPDCAAFENPAGGHHGNCRLKPGLDAARFALSRIEVGK